MQQSHFWYNKRQRNGILFLAIIIVILQLVYFFVDFSSTEKTDLSTPEIVKFEKEIDSLKKIALENKKPKIYPFNPSFITDFKGYQLGMSPQEIDKLLAYRSQGKYINSTEEFQKITGVSDSLLNVISPYFKFPDWVNKTNKSNVILSQNEESNNKYLIKDLNSATAEDLKSINGVGDKLAKRIVKYRTKLGGFLIKEQLYEVYYLDKPVANKILKRFTILQKPSIKKININDATFKEVLAIPYINYELTKKIFNYCDEVSKVQSIEELKKIDGFPVEKFDRIALYLIAK